MVFSQDCPGLHVPPLAISSKNETVAYFFAFLPSAPHFGKSNPFGLARDAHKVLSSTYSETTAPKWETLTRTPFLSALKRQNVCVCVCLFGQSSLYTLLILCNSFFSHFLN